VAKLTSACSSFNVFSQQHDNSQDVDESHVVVTDAPTECRRDVCHCERQP